ncbi:MAG: bifunctional metallophosphatase/5'-nucleotidase [Schwartzia sp.]|nr:bifunctional metallophosphatase/5'-nucleotidase [Schwartzia sp. (in: firmicutes)]
MKQRFHRFLSLLLTLVFTLAFSAIAWAADVVILHTNDIHCGVEDNVGVARLSQYKKDLKKQGLAVLLVDAGDAVQGAPIGKLSKGESIVNIMNAIGYDFLIPGNHEFDYGMEQFFRLNSLQKTKYFSCNFTDLRTGNLCLSPYKVVSAGGHKIAFVGVTTPETLATSTPKYFQDENGKFIYGFSEDNSGAKIYAAIQKAVDAAKAEGAEYVIVVGHLGVNGSIPKWSSITIAENTRGVTAIIDGHSHEQFDTLMAKNKDGKDVLITQTGTKMQTVGKLVIHDDGTMTSTLEKEDTLPNPDPKNLKVIEKENKKFEPILKQTVGEALVDLCERDPATGERRVRSQETNMGDFVADAFRAVLNTDIALVNGGSLRNKISKGVFTYQDILTAFPFGNMSSAVEVTGQTILDALELSAMNLPEENGGFLQVSGLTYEIHTYIDTPCKQDENTLFAGIDGERRVQNVLVNGKPIDPKATYTLASHDYMLLNQGDGYSMFGGCKLLQDRVKLDNQVLIDYIVDTLGGTVGEQYDNPYGEGRIVIVEEKP